MAYEDDLKAAKDAARRENPNFDKQNDRRQNADVRRQLNNIQRNR